MLLFTLQVCTKGFFLSEHNVCLPCNCKGHADSCDDITGICIVSVVILLVALLSCWLLLLVVIIHIKELQGPQYR